MRKCRHEPADQIKQQIRKMAKMILDIVAENPQHPHVADNVQPRAMQEDGRQNWKKNSSQIQMRQRDFDVRRNYSKLIYKTVQCPVTLRLNRQLIKKRQRIQCNNEIVDEWTAEARLIIANGNHAGFGNLVIG